MFVISLAATLIFTRREAQSHESAERPAVPSLVGALPSQPPDWVSGRRLRSRLRAEGRRSRRDPRITVLLGESGIGKSHAAAEYARKRHSDGWLVVWIDASSEASAALELATAARSLGLTGKRRPRSGAELLRDQLQSRTEPSLVVFDGAVDRDSFERWMPAAGPNHIIVTTTFSGLGVLGTPVNVQGFNRRQSARYLRARLPGTSRADRDVLRQTVGQIPATLWSATGVIRSERLQISEYLARFRIAPLAAVLRDTSRNYRRSPSGALEAVDQSLRSFRERSTASLCRLTSDDVLNVASLIAPVEIDARLLDPSDTGVGDRVLASLADWSLASWNLGNCSVNLHDLSARFVREGMSPVELERISGHFVELVHHAWPSSDGRAEDAPSVIDYLVRATESCWRNTNSRLRGVAVRARLLELRLGSATWAFTQGDYRTAQTIADSVRMATEPLQDERCSPLHLSALDASAHALLASGEKSRAIVLYRSVVDQQVASLGSADLQTLEAQVALGNALRSNGEITEAIELFHSLLAKNLSPEIRSKAQGSLGFALLRDGQSEAAAEVLRHVVAERSMRLGDNSLSTLIALNNLGRALLSLGDDAALPLLDEAFEMKSAAVGRDHPQTLVSGHYLGVAEVHFGDRDRGRALLRDTYERRVAVLGADHPDTLATYAQITRPVSAQHTTAGGAV